EILPKLDTKVGKADAERFCSHVRSKGYKLDHSDCDDGNLGYLPDGTVVGVDKHCIRVTTTPQITAADKSHWLVFKPHVPSLFPYLDAQGYISKQEHCFPALTSGVRGVLTNRDIENLENGKFAAVRDKKPECFKGITEDNLEEFIYLVKDQALYPSQARAVLREHGMITEEPEHARRAKSREQSETRRS
ncbi:MAG: hypothetical protein K2Q01_11710, partial [Rickettsiales bacterium]|nr:hypothetical protein [Rickettsiales bacterium]